MNRNWDTALGFYSKPETALNVLVQARSKGFLRSALITRTSVVKGYAPCRSLIAGTLFFLALLFACIYVAPSIIYTHFLVGLFFFIGLCGWWVYDFLHHKLPDKLLKKFQNLVINDETLLLIQVHPEQVGEVLSLLRQVQSGHPTSFLMRAAVLDEEQSQEEFLKEPLNSEQVNQLAIELAEKSKSASVYWGYKNPLLSTLKKSSRVLSKIRHDVAEAEHLEQTISSSAEWLLDNSYVIQGTIEDVQRNLPKKFFQDLPKIDGEPRIYFLAKEMIRTSANRLNRDNITAFLKSYQSVEPLTIGELWALPLMLRLRLVHVIEYLARDIDRRLCEGEVASFWGNRLLNSSRRDPKRVAEFLSAMKEEVQHPSAHFIEELMDHLFDEEKVLPLVKELFEADYKAPIADLVHQEQVEKTQEQVAFSSAIISLITLSQLSWKEVFESNSVVDSIFAQDPDSTYPAMDFATQDLYRKEVEKLAKGSKMSESDVARQVLYLASQGKEGIAQHVGFYLIDKGRWALEEHLKYQPSLYHRLQEYLLHYPSVIYLGLIVFFIALIIGSLAIGQFAYALLILALIPASEIAIQVLNLLLSRFLPPFLLPKMQYKAGIPKELRTLVVIPTLLVNKASIKENINRLEIHYLANQDTALRFAILVDFVDAPTKQTEADVPILEYTLNGIKWLEEKYGKDRFFLLMRERMYSSVESAWIGWERKRGKLESLNQYLVEGVSNELIIKWGNPEALKGVRYVITLDSDTQLPKDTARQLVATIHHPLNKPHIGEDGKVERGYTIIQPRVSANYAQSMLTLFSFIFADEMAVDPYTQAISNVYQDLMQEGTYHGKGIYDVGAFHRLMKGRFPDEHLLSHDLIEGIYGRVAFASDINLLDLYPRDYLTWSNRQHRWMRGDWQIIDWLFPQVPNASKTKVKNFLSLISRWKIFDNLRRALLPVACLALLITAWFISPYPAFWTSFVLFTIFLPAVCLVASNLFTDPRSILMSKNQFINAILRAFINTALLPHQAYLSLDALVRVSYRRLISKKKLLEWQVSNQAKNAKKRRFVLHLTLFSLFACLLFLVIKIRHPVAIASAASVLSLWLISPLIVYLMDRPFVREAISRLTQSDKLFIRNVARRTFRYFDHFVGPDTNYLPPDNFQSSLVVEVAERTSPTNIGLYLLSILGAYDFRYLTGDAMLDRIAETFNSFKKMEMHEGHFLNWYDTKLLRPLTPRYVSTVDSGNFLASLWALEQGVYEMLSEPILPHDLLSGLKDSFDLGVEKIQDRGIKNRLQPLDKILSRTPKRLPELISSVREAKSWVEKFVQVESLGISTDGYWAQKLQQELDSWDSVISRYFSWIEEYPIDKGSISLRDLATGRVVLEPASKEKVASAQWFAGEKMGQARVIIDAIHEISKNMNMGFLYNADRKLFAIGYNVDESKMDSSFYDLLASEARLASLVSIAKDDVPIDHWWALSRAYRFIDGQQVLMSWGGTMFEYLMPLLFNQYFSESLLGEACSAAVNVQMKYGKKRGIAWGISEAAYSEIDIRRIYQYRSFGVPGLGFKQGLDEDLVVSPYSTALALAVDPKNAIKNLRMLDGEQYKMLSTYGFYESIDFARQKGPHGERGVVVYAYFAHHQGMSFLAFNNLLHGNIVAKRFHANPRIAGIEPLLLEKVPIYPPIAKGIRRDRPVTRLTPFSTVPIMGLVETPHSTTPKVNLLSNGEYSIMVTNSGGSYSHWRDFDITRWYADSTRDFWGTFCYIQDLKIGAAWSSGYHPMKTQGRNYAVTFKADKVDIKRRDHDIETLLEIVVSPEDDAEVRLLTITNLSKEERQLQFTSFSELVLASHAADRAHPIFNKMFIQTEKLEEVPGILAYRRLRSPHDTQLFAGHVVASNHPFSGTIEYETDRVQFVGRGGSSENPLALEKSLSGTVGYVLDPIFSLRVKLGVKAGAKVQLSFITIATDTREKTVSLVKKYADFYASIRALEMAWTHSQLELRHLRIHQEEAQLFQKLAGRVLYPHGQLRPSTDQLVRNRLGQSSLWAYGISGDLPIVIVALGDQHDIDLVRQMLTAHNFWRLRGLKVDLVVLNEEGESYEHPLYHQLFKLIQSHSQLTEMGKPGGVYLINRDQISQEDLTLLLSVSTANLIAARGFLRQQLVSPVESTRYAPRLLINRPQQGHSTPELPFWELSYYNGYGGYTLDGKEYVIYLENGKETPLPWSNVMSNPLFGTLVTESGLGATWYGNSQTNRITPWSNDPLLNPIHDCIYIRDNESGQFWTLTPRPIREKEGYRIRFGQGYTHFEHNSQGLEQELTIFVPVDETGGAPLRIQVVKLKNCTSLKRSIALFGYLEWVLGSDREQTERHVITEWDPESQSLFAYNHYNSDYKDYIAFAACTPLPQSFTGNRTEFLGRNHHHSNPYSLRRKHLTGTTGAALDPCAALHVDVDLGPYEQKEVTFVLGYAPSREIARKYIQQCRDAGAIEQLLHHTAGYWDKIASGVQVETPDKGLNYSLNRWLPYQVLSCRYWGRIGFYQASGAFGFRDQLQDVMALLYSAPDLTRAHILYAAAHQFLEGDVQHWWHPPFNGGVRTRISDDLLWLPFVTAQYVRVTGDTSILHEEVPFLKGDLLKPDQEESYFVPEIAEEKGTLLEHCRRAIYKGITGGYHGLPLIGTGDWNDGMNLVGVHGKGESVWLGWFLVHVMKDFAELLASVGEEGSSEGFKAQAKRLAEQIEKTAWDGSWYKRAYFDDGTPLGSSENREGQIDSLPQSWSVICGEGVVERSKQALAAVEQHLVKQQDKMILLLTPAFNEMVPDPGYIKGYPPGVRENGGQYTHGSLWVPLAFSRLGEGDKSFQLMHMMHPLSHTENKEGVEKYKTEPYVLSGDVYSLPTQVGRGGWSWYTGAAGWMYRIYIEEMIGLKVRGGKFTLHPVIPAHWNGVKVRYKNYDITLVNARGQELHFELDGVKCDPWIEVIEDGKVRYLSVKWI